VTSPWEVLVDGVIDPSRSVSAKRQDPGDVAAILRFWMRRASNEMGVGQMDLIDVGLNLLASPFGWVAALGAPLLAVGIAIRAWGADLGDELKKVVVAGVAVFILLELPTVVTAYIKAADACRSGAASAAECMGIPGV